MCAVSFKRLLGRTRIVALRGIQPAERCLPNSGARNVRGIAVIAAVLGEVNLAAQALTLEGSAVAVWAIGVILHPRHPTTYVFFDPSRISPVQTCPLCAIEPLRRRGLDRTSTLSNRIGNHLHRGITK